MNRVYPLDVASGYPQAGMTGGGAAPSPEGGITLQHLVLAVRRRLSLMAAVFVLIVAAVAIYTYQMTPIYTATSSVIVQPRDNRVIDIGAVISGMPADAAALDTEAQILQSRILIEKVVRRLDLTSNPMFNASLAEPSAADRRMQSIKDFVKGLIPFRRAAAPAAPQDPAVAERELLEDVVSGVTGAYNINRRGSTRILEITARSPDPEMAALLANTLADVYLDNQLDTKFDATRRAQEWLNVRVQQLRDEVRDAESRVEAHRASTGLLSAQGSTLTEQAIRDLNGQLTIAQADLGERRARLQNVQSKIAAGGGVDTIAEALNSPAILDLRRQLGEVLRRKADLRARYFDNHPDVVRVLNEEADLNRQVDTELRRIVSSLEQDVLIGQERVRALQGRLNVTRGELATNSRDAVLLGELDREAQASRMLYEEFLNRYKETTELDDITEADATINSLAPVPRTPSEPRKSINLMLGVLMGFALAGAVGLVAELMDRYLTTPEDVEQVTGAPFIGQIPLLTASASFAKARSRPADYLIEKPHSGFAEAFRHLRASIMFADIDKAAKTVAVVSSLPDEGKTSMTFCLGRMAAMSGTKAIVIDGDLRRRQLTETSGVAAEQGLLEYLFGEARLSDVVVTDEPTGLHILPLSDRKHTPRDVFGSRAFDAMLSMLQQSYDLIVIDTGPILLMAETRVVTKKVDQVVVAARWRKTHRHTLRETMKVLRDFNANIAGVVLTFVDLRKRAHHAYSAANYKSYAKYYHE